LQPHGEGMSSRGSIRQCVGTLSPCLFFIPVDFASLTGAIKRGRGAGLAEELAPRALAFLSHRDDEAAVGLEGDLQLSAGRVERLAHKASE